MAGRRQRTERRRFDRLPLVIPLFVRGLDERGKQFIEFANAVNISAGGALLAMRRFLPRSSQVSLEIPSAPLLQREISTPFVRNLQAKVIRVGHSNKFSLSGLRFTRPLV